VASNVWWLVYGCRGGLGLFEGVTDLKEKMVRLERENQKLKEQLESE